MQLSFASGVVRNPGHWLLLYTSFRKMGSGVFIKNAIKNHRIIGRMVFPGSRNRTFFCASSPNSQLLDIFNPTEVRVWRIGMVALAKAAVAVQLCFGKDEILPHPQQLYALISVNMHHIFINMCSARPYPSHPS